jgi:hypothetical protein
MHTRQQQRKPITLYVEVVTTTLVSEGTIAPQRGRPLVFCLALVLVAGVLACVANYRASLALSTDSFSVGGNSFTADKLDAPTGVSASGGVCITLTWTATADTYASGHRILRSASPSGPFTQIAAITPRTSVAYTDRVATGTYFYVVRAFYQNWESVDSNQVSAASVNLGGLLPCV